MPCFILFLFYLSAVVWVFKTANRDVRKAETDKEKGLIIVLSIIFLLFINSVFQMACY